MTSPEFRLKNPDLAYSIEPNIVIKEIDDRLRLFLDLSDVVIGLNTIRGQYERSEANFVRRTVRPGQTVLDIGVHIGYYTITMASLVGPSGKVYAFEPFDQAADLLERSISENRFEDRVTLERVAVEQSSGFGKLLFIRRTLNSGGSHLIRDGTEVPPGHEVKDVRLIALDDYPIHRPVSFIKIDIEGSEHLAFRGAERILREDQPVILSEILPVLLEKVSGCKPAQFISEMRARGYDCHVLEDNKPAGKITDTDSLKSVVFLPKQ